MCYQSRGEWNETTNFLSIRVKKSSSSTVWDELWSLKNPCLKLLSEYFFKVSPLEKEGYSVVSNEDKSRLPFPLCCSSAQLPVFTELANFLHQNVPWEKSILYGQLLHKTQSICQQTHTNVTSVDSFVFLFHNIKIIYLFSCKLPFNSLYLKGAIRGIAPYKEKNQLPCKLKGQDAKLT